MLHLASNSVNQVNQRLREAKRYFNALTAEDLLPTAMLDLPRRKGISLGPANPRRELDIYVTEVCAHGKNFM